MYNLNIDDGFREFTINEDPNRIIRFNPSDIAIIDRFNTAKKNIEAKVAEVNEKADQAMADDDRLDAGSKFIAKLDEFIKEQIDFIFNSPVSDIVFGSQSPMASVHGKPFFERFVDAAQEYITMCLEEENKASEKRIAKYTKAYRK